MLEQPLLTLTCLGEVVLIRRNAVVDGRLTAVSGDATGKGVGKRVVLAEDVGRHVVRRRAVLEAGNGVFALELKASIVNGSGGLRRVSGTCSDWLIVVKALNMRADLVDVDRVGHCIENVGRVVNFGLRSRLFVHVCGVGIM